MRVAIIGAEQAKFTKESAARAIQLIETLITPSDIVVSGACHLGGVDIWAEEAANKIGAKKLIFPPKRLVWTGGYKDRNIQIADNCDIVHVVVVDKYPPGYNGMKFDGCYHCNIGNHVKSGACWTAHRANQRNKVPAVWWMIYQDRDAFTRWEFS